MQGTFHVPAEELQEVAGVGDFNIGAQKGSAL